MSLQKFIVRSLLKLPSSMLIGMSGGKPLEIDGRVLNPQFQFLASGASKQPPMSSLAADEGRAGSAAGLEMLKAKPDTGVQWNDFDIPSSSSHRIPVRMYRPDEIDRDAPMMTFFHFGGGVIGDLETCHAFCTIFSKIVKCPVLSVDYRLAPEHPFPAGLNDCKDAYEWVLENGKDYGAPEGISAIGGDSMGGNFSAIICQDMKKEGKTLPVLQLLIYPATNLVDELPSHKTYGETYPLSSDTMDWFMEHYIPASVDRSDLRLSPALSEDLSGLPAAYVITAGFDPLLDDGQQYAEKLGEAGVAVHYDCYDSLAHGFTAFTGVCTEADEACREIARKIRLAYDGIENKK